MGQREESRQRNRCFGRARGADRGPWPAVGPRALSPNLRAGARTPAPQPPPAIQPRGEQGHGPVCVCRGAQAAAGSSPRTCCSCEKRLPRQGCCSPVPGRAPPAFGSATRERTANTSVRDEGEMGQGLFGSCGGDPAPSLGCHVPTPSFRQQANQPARPPGPVTRTPVSGSGQVAGSVTGKNLCRSRSKPRSEKTSRVRRALRAISRAVSGDTSRSGFARGEEAGGRRRWEVPGPDPIQAERENVE